MPLAQEEARNIAALINPQFDEVLGLYDIEKYSPARYQDFQNTFACLRRCVFDPSYRKSLTQSFAKHSACLYRILEVD